MHGVGVALVGCSCAFALDVVTVYALSDLASCCSGSVSVFHVQRGSIALLMYHSFKIMVTVYGIFLYDMSNTTQLVMPANDMTGAVI